MQIKSNRTGEAGSRRQYAMTPRSFVKGNFEQLNEQARSNSTKCLFSNDLEHVDALPLDAMNSAHPWTAQFTDKVGELRRATSFVLFTQIGEDRDALFFQVENGGRLSLKSLPATDALVDAPGLGVS